MAAQEEKELEIRLQFLDEAQDYLNTVEKALLGLADRQIDTQEMNAVLRAAHSIKGGAAMMGLNTLSELAHRIEDSFKVLKVQKDGVEVDAAIEKLLLDGVDCLRRVVDLSRQGDQIDQHWLDITVQPIFDQLHDRLGEPQTEDVNSMLSQDEGMDITILLFETEVEGCLQRLENSLAAHDPRLREEVEILAQELEGLGDMLEIPAFSQLCQSVGHYLAEAPEQTEKIARLTLEAWRRSQALVLTGYLAALPTTISEIGFASTGDANSVELSDVLEDAGLDSEPLEDNVLANNILENDILASDILASDISASDILAGDILASNISANDILENEAERESISLFSNQSLLTNQSSFSDSVSDEEVEAIAAEDISLDILEADDLPLDIGADDLSLDMEMSHSTSFYELIGLDWETTTPVVEATSTSDVEQVAEQTEAVDAAGLANATEQALTEQVVDELPLNATVLTDLTTEPDATQTYPDIVSSLFDEQAIGVDSTPVTVSVDESDATVLQSVISDSQPISKTVHSTPSQSSSSKKRITPRETRTTDFRVLDEPTAAGNQQENTVRVPIKQLDQLNDLFGELTIERNQLDLEVKRLRKLVQSMSYRMQVLDQANAQLRTVYDTVATQTKVNVPSSKGGSTAGQQYRDADGHSLYAGRLPLWGTAKQSQQTAIIPIVESQSPDLGKFDSLEMDRYGEMHSVFQSVMETIVQLQEVTDDINLDLDDTEQTVRDLNKTSKQLQTNLTQLRMRPLADVVDRFPRALRELSLQHGKTVRLRTTGSSTLVDRNILEALHDPLMHILRNAFDHGIEDAETRRALGKSEEGLIEIRAFHRGDRTIITVSDDGGGIPLDKVRAKALQMGLDKSLLAVASEDELLSLIFEPGFSTADQVTSLSGRGVGMDVVRNNLKQVRGEVKVDTRPSIGTTFTISVPFTLSVTRVLLAESNGMILAFPTDAIEEIIILPPEQLISSIGSTAFDWGGTMVQLIYLSQWLTFNCPRYLEGLETPPTIDVPTVLMLKQNEELIGLQIERSWGEQEVAIRRIEGGPPMPAGFANCTILGDGRVVPLVNVAELLHWGASYERSAIDLHSSKLNFPKSDEREGTLPALLNSFELPKLKSGAPKLDAPTSTVEQKSTILIVDDSIAVRRMLALTLENAGYRVVQAKDGQDALDKLSGGLQVQAAICDIEMPRLDGYGFLVKTKATPDLAQLPVVMLTSRSGDKHRQVAMNLGAIAYFAKPYDERALLQTVQQVIQVASTV